MERTDELVEQLRVWYRTCGARQKDLAVALGLTPQGLAEILGGRNRPTGEQTLRILDFLITENMTPNRSRTGRASSLEPLSDSERPREPSAVLAKVKPKPPKHVATPDGRVVAGQSAEGQRILEEQVVAAVNLARPKASRPMTVAKVKYMIEAFRRKRLLSKQLKETALAKEEKRYEVANAGAAPAAATKPPAKHAAAKPALSPKPAERFSQNALACFNMAVSTLRRTDIREGKKLLLAHHYLQSSGDPFFSSINPIELLKEVKELYV